MVVKINAKETFEGDGLIVNRLFPVPNRMNFDPFVLWDHFDIVTEHGFPDHPHRGFEAITYILNGGIHHKDNLGNDSFVSKGGAQVFCAGSGIVHSEMPEKGMPIAGIQLWINLPKRLKQINPSYQQILSDDLPVVDFVGGSCRTIVGEDAPVKLHTDITYQHITLRKDSDYQIRINSGLNAIIYVLSGGLTLNNDTANPTESFLIQAEGQQDLLIKASKDSEFMFCCGASHNEPIHQHGPYVD